MKNGFWKVFSYECLKLVHSPKRIFITLGLPMLLFFFFGSLFQVGKPSNFSVALVDYDQSPLSRKLIRGLEATPEISFSTIVKSEEEAQRLMQRGDLYGLIIIPKDFEKEVMQGKQTKAICYTNGQFLLPSGNISKAFRTTIKTFSAGINLEKRKKKGEESALAYTNVRPIGLDVHTMYNPYINYGYYLITPFLPFMLEMIVMILSIYVLATPLKYHKAKAWLKMAGGNSWVALWGKLLPYTLVFFFMSWWMNFYLFKIIGTPLQVPLFNVFLMTCLLVLVHQFLAVFFVSIAKDMRSALTFGAGFCAICFSFGAYTFPLEGLPKFIQDIANIFPYTHFIKYYINRAIKGIPMDYTLNNLYALGAYLVLFLAIYPLFVKKLKKGSYE